MTELKQLEDLDIPSSIIGKGRTVLAVDDEITNLDIISAYLKDSGFNTIFAKDGFEALNLLEADHENISVILLDKMMPKMDGMEFIKNVHNHPTLPNIPIIMQTAAAEKDSIVEGINAGVFYYLTKPYEEGMLVSVVQAAANDFELHQSLRKKVNQQRRMMGMLTSSSFEFVTIDDAKDLAIFLANFCPNPEKVILGLSELMINAVEHGNLQIGYERKTQLLREGKWEEEISIRQGLPQNKGKIVKMDFEKASDHIGITIEDSGDGFDWEPYMDISSKRASDNHGRGIALANLLSFDGIEYMGCGNRVKATVNL